MNSWWSSMHQKTKRKYFMHISKTHSLVLISVFLLLLLLSYSLAPGHLLCFYFQLLLPFWIEVCLFVYLCVISRLACYDKSSFLISMFIYSIACQFSLSFSQFFFCFMEQVSTSNKYEQQIKWVVRCAFLENI